ncbi:YfdX family protein, partial [Ancylomarina sp.]|uniref:YfdX family protein n=1 Tax=Ancylomarina sp. TaxID=1970196 RepID=UPI0035693493
SIESEKSELVEEAVSSYESVNEALSAIELSDKRKAIAALEKAVGKLEVLLARDPDLAFVPVDAFIKTVDLSTDLETIISIKKAAKKAIADDRFQSVRDEISNLASEIQISTVEIPLATFPAALKRAAAELEKDNLQEAKVILHIAINTFLISEQRIPLPILRAQAIINQAKSDDASSEDKKKEVTQLLENAEYQILMAEELGYGKRDKEYAELYKSIKELKKSVKADKDSQGLFDSLKNKLEAFKNRIVS